jgi:hypothetical protein
MGFCPEDVGSKFKETPVSLFQTIHKYTPQDMLEAYVMFSMSVLQHMVVI